MKEYLQENIKMKINIDSIQVFLLKVFILLLPYHYMVICVLGRELHWIRLWKEAIIILMLILDIAKHIKSKEKYEIFSIDIISIFFFAILLIYISFSDDIYSAISMARIYFIPMLLIPILRHMQIDNLQLKRIIYLLAINCIILSIWGIVQSVFLGDKFLIYIGYEHYFNEYLGYERLQSAFYVSGITGFQRLTSTFVAPNTCAMYFSFVFTLILYLHKKIEMNSKLYYSSIFIISIAILLTFSRSTWIAWGIAIFIYLIKYVRFNKKSIKYMTISVMGIIVLITIVDRFILKGTIINIGTHIIYNTVSFKDSSMIGHIDSIKESFEIIKNNIWGLGIGRNGPRAISLLGSNNANLTESSYFLIFYDVGIIGFLIYFAVYIKAIIDNIIIIKKNNSNIIIVISVIVIMFLISYIFLPYVQEFELLAMLYLIIGIQYNKHIHEISEVN